MLRYPNKDTQLKSTRRYTLDINLKISSINDIREMNTMQYLQYNESLLYATNSPCGTENTEQNDKVSNRQRIIFDD